MKKLQPRLMAAHRSVAVAARLLVVPWVLGKFLWNLTWHRTGPCRLYLVVLVGVSLVGMAGFTLQGSLTSDRLCAALLLRVLPVCADQTACPKGPTDRVDVVNKRATSCKTPIRRRPAIRAELEPLPRNLAPCK